MGLEPALGYVWITIPPVQGLQGGSGLEEGDAEELGKKEEEKKEEEEEEDDKEEDQEKKEEEAV